MQAAKRAEKNAAIFLMQGKENNNWEEIFLERFATILIINRVLYK